MGVEELAIARRCSNKEPLSSEYGTCKTVKASSGLGFQVKVFKIF